MVRVGILGCGRIAERHLRSYSKMRDVEVVVTDVEAERAAQKAHAFGVRKTASYEDMLDDAVDAVDICVPTRHHYDAVLRALAHGKHVFCEKPLCMTSQEARQICEAGKIADRSVMVGYLYRFHPAYEFARDVLERGIIGTPYFAIFRLGGRGASASWKHDVEFGGGAVLEMLVHMIDLALWLLGEFTEVRVHAMDTLLRERDIQGLRQSVTAEDHVVVTLERDGLRALCEGDLFTPSYMNYVEVQSEGGSLLTSILQYMPTILYCHEATDVYNQGNNFFTFPHTNLFDRELGEFVNLVRDDVSSQDSVRDSMRVMAILEQISNARKVRC